MLLSHKFTVFFFEPQLQRIQVMRLGKSQDLLLVLFEFESKLMLRTRRKPNKCPILLALQVVCAGHIIQYLLLQLWIQF